MKKNNKKPAIANNHTRVLIETIAAYTIFTKSIRIFFRNGTSLEMHWQRTGAAKAAKILDEHFNILEVE